jgi:hypothetical protein
MTVASLVPTAWASSRADIAPARGPAANKNSAIVRSTGVLRRADLAASVAAVVFPSDFRTMCCECYTGVRVAALVTGYVMTLGKLDAERRAACG